MFPRISTLSQSAARTVAMAARIAATSLTLAAALTGSARAQSPSTEPLIQSSNITYLGAFALPSWANGAKYGTSYFEYGGHALMVYHDPTSGQTTLYMEGDAQIPGNVAQVQVPSTLVSSTNWSSLPMATVLQNFADVGSNPDPSSCVGNPAFTYGMMAYGGRLIMAAACSYGGAQTTSHGARSLNLSTAGFQGWYGFSGANAPPRALAGPMLAIPPEWQAAFGGPAFTGQCCISVTGSTSAGPSLTVFNPSNVGVTNPIPGTTVLFYPLSNPACGALHCEAAQSNIYNLTTVYGGAAFPAGSRSVLFVMATGTGPYCYGSASDCGNDTALQGVNGPHAQPYRYQILAYDANDLMAVKAGTKQSWQPTPYAVIVLNGMPFSGDDEIKGAGYDPTTGRLYIAQNYSETPRIEVYQITVPGGVVTPPPTTTPNPPMGVKAQ